jgi:hypothetical protein
MGEAMSLHIYWQTDADEFPRCAYAVELRYVGEKIFSALEIEMQAAKLGLGVWFVSDIRGIEELESEFLALVEGLGESR